MSTKEKSSDEETIDAEPKYSTGEYTRSTEHGLVATDEFFEDKPWMTGSVDEMVEHYHGEE